MERAKHLPLWLSLLWFVWPASLSAQTCTPQWNSPASLVNPGLNNFVWALAVYDDGTGPALYAGGEFDYSGTRVVRGIAKWTDTGWISVGGGVDDPFDSDVAVYALAVYDDGTGPALYAGGRFALAGGITVGNLARWNGQTWSTVQGSGGYGAAGTVYALEVFDDGTGPALYVGGNFTTVGGTVSANRVARYKSTGWSAVGAGLNNTVYTIEASVDSRGPALFVGGDFTASGATTMNRVAKWSKGTPIPLYGWRALSTGMNDRVWDLEGFDDGTGAAMYAAGAFTTAGGTAAAHLARWNGSAWSPVGGGTDGTAYSLGLFDDGSGSALYVGGSFSHAGGVAGTSGIAQWDGVTWSSLGGGVPDVVSMTTFDNGGGLDLYVGGAIWPPGGIASYIGRWDGCLGFTPSASVPTLAPWGSAALVLALAVTGLRIRRAGRRG